SLTRAGGYTSPYMLSSWSIVVTRWSVKAISGSGWFGTLISQCLAHDHAAIALSLPLGVFDEAKSAAAVQFDQVEGGLRRVERELVRPGGPRHVLDRAHQSCADAAHLQRRLDRELPDMRHLGSAQPGRAEFAAGRLEAGRADHAGVCIDG